MKKLFIIVPAILILGAMAYFGFKLYQNKLVINNLTNQTINTDQFANSKDINTSTTTNTKNQATITSQSQLTSENIYFAPQTYYLQEGDSDASTNGEVSKLQNFLIEKGFYQGSITGSFDEATKQAVINYQKSKGLTAEGFVGNMTRSMMNGDEGSEEDINSNKNNNIKIEFHFGESAENSWVKGTPYFVYVTGKNLSIIKMVEIIGSKVDLQVAFTVIDNNSGSFVPPNLNPGNYSIVPCNGTSECFSPIPFKVYPALGTPEASVVTWKSLQFATPTPISINYPTMNGIELKPDLFTIDKSKLNSKGCNPQYLNDSSGTILVINNITICQRNISDAAMGTIYNLSDNVFQSNGQYYRLSFQLNQDNMCFGSDYQDYCFERNSAIGSLWKLLNQSVATLKVLK